MPEARAIKSMFNNISSSYDMINDVLSLGIHRLWKKALVQEMVKTNPAKILDCATGTGDIAIMMKELNPSSKLTGVDFSEKMLAQAQKKTRQITWGVQDVMNMTFEDKEFNATSISYGIRNVENYEVALKEMSRVTRDKICVLEFGQPSNPIFKFIYFAIMKYFIPLIGKIFKKEEAYKYLIESSMKFPCAQDFCEVMARTTDFKKVQYKSFFGGVTYLYTATKREGEND